MSAGNRWYQCPGCWSATRLPMTENGYECDCGERMFIIDLRDTEPSPFAASPGARHDVPDLDWRAAVIAVVDACDAELDGGAANDFERGADAAYNWVLSVIDGNVLVAARPPVLVPRDEPTREDIEG